LELKSTSGQLTIEISLNAVEHGKKPVLSHVKWEKYLIYGFNYPKVRWKRIHNPQKIAPRLALPRIENVLTQAMRHELHTENFLIKI
jgi:hypothetical protein